jgi:hypothetical protein
MTLLLLLLVLVLVVVLVLVLLLLCSFQYSFTRATIPLTSECDRDTTFKVKMQILFSKLHLIRPLMYLTSTKCLPRSITLYLFVHLNIFL